MIPMSNVRAGTKIEQAAVGTTIAVPYPAGVRLDDVLVLFVNVFNTTTLPTLPAGWASDGSIGSTGTTAAPTALLCHRAASTADVTASAASGTLSVTIPNNAALGGMIAIPAVDLLQILDVAAMTPLDMTTASANVAMAGLTTVRDSCMLVAGVTNVSPGNTFTPPTAPSAFVEDIEGAGTRSGEVSHGLAGAAGATGTITAVASGSGKALGFLIALRPGPPVGGLMTVA
jgi:hypothetical protein